MNYASGLLVHDDSAMVQVRNIIHHNHSYSRFVLGTSLIIIELVDSICRDSADTQYTTMQRISQSLKNSKLTSLYNKVLFIALKCFHDQQDSYWHEIGIMTGSSHLRTAMMCKIALLYAPFGCTHPRTPVPPFLLAQNLSHKDIARSDITSSKSASFN